MVPARYLASFCSGGTDLTTIVLEQIARMLHLEQEFESEVDQRFCCSRYDNEIPGIFSPGAEFLWVDLKEVMFEIVAEVVVLLLEEVAECRLEKR